MLFNSFAFLIFLPTVFFSYWLVFNKSVRGQNLLLLAASYFFYGWWSWMFLGLLASSTLLDFIYGFSVASPNKKKAKFFLWLSIINNLGILGVFKYYDFFALQLQQGLQLMGLHPGIALLNFVLPVGISFYTFHGMSYVFDIYRGKQKPVSNFIDYAVFVSFFPILVAGPIERANHLLPQVQQKRSFNYNQAVEGCRLILWGMFKKVAIADNLSGTVGDIYANYHAYSGFSIIMGAIGFSFQIYCDFSGYTDIALGTAKLLGFELLTNFKFPYFSRDVSEFWRRWHISLSSWFRDYLYIPLGGSKSGKLKTARNVFIIFLVSGFWHGASWNFIIWGFMHACCFLPLLLLQRNRKYGSEIVAAGKSFPSFTELWQMVTTFLLVTVAWVFFRAPTVSDAVKFLFRIVTDSVANPRQYLSLPTNGKMIFLYIIPFILMDWWLRRDERKIRITRFRAVNWLVYTVMLCIIFNLFLNYLNQKPGGFIYFQF